MIKIPLSIQGARTQLLLNPDPLALPWTKRKDYCWNYKYDKTNLTAPFNQVFLKRWIGGMSPAHQLLETTQGQKIPGTPCIMGMGQAGPDWIYVFERVPKSYQDLSGLLNRVGREKYLTGDVLLSIVNTASACFAKLANYNHVYTDLSVQNIMVDPANKDVALIDLDSGWSYSRLENQKGKFTNHFDSYYWYFWDTYLLPARSPLLPSPEKLPMALVLAFAAVWSRAIGILQSQQHTDQDAFRLISAPSGDMQEQFWIAIQKGNQRVFYDYLLLSSRTDGAFQEWRELFNELVAGRFVAWRDIRKATTDLAACYPPQKTPVVVTPPSLKPYVPFTPQKPLIPPKIFDPADIITPPPSTAPQPIPHVDAVKRRKRSKSEVFFDPLGFYALMRRLRGE